MQVDKPYKADNDKVRTRYNHSTSLISSLVDHKTDDSLESREYPYHGVRITQAQSEVSTRTRVA